MLQPATEHYKVAQLETIFTEISHALLSLDLPLLFEVSVTRTGDFLKSDRHYPT